MTDVRMIVYEALLEVEKGQNSKDMGKSMLDKYAYLDKQQRAFMHFLFEGVIDKKITLDYVIDSLSKVPVSKMKKPVRTLIRMGAYQILFMDSVPDRAACNETVAIARKKHLDKLSGFINGVLRSICRLEGNIVYPSKDNELIKYLSVYYSMPEIVVKSLAKDYGEEECEKILADMLANRPIIGRGIECRGDADTLVDKLNNYAGVNVKKIEGTNAFVFEELDSLLDIPEFSEGLFTIQDLSSQMVGMIAGYKAGDVIIDVCASPGGKSIHAADLLKKCEKLDKPVISKEGSVISCDISEDKVMRIQENVERCQLDNVEMQVMDATVFNPEFEGEADVVICDAPCSGLGVMARKRDIKYALTETGFEDLRLLQRRIIENTVKYVKTGGTFIYSTCTMRKAENDEQFEYIKNELGFEPVSFYDELPDNYKCESSKDGFMQLYAGRNNTDGFFISKFCKSE